MRIGDAAGRIIQVTTSGVEYADAVGTVHTIDLETCRRLAGVKRIALRGAIDVPPWVEFTDERRTRFLFDSAPSMYRQLIVPSGRAGWGTWDAN